MECRALSLFSHSPGSLNAITIFPFNGSQRPTAAYFTLHYFSLIISDQSDAAAALLTSVFHFHALKYDGKNDRARSTAF